MADIEAEQREHRPPYRRRQRVERQEGPEPHLRRADRDRADGAQAVDEAEGEDEAGRAPLEQVERAGEGLLGLDANDPAMILEATADREPDLVAAARAARRAAARRHQ